MIVNFLSAPLTGKSSDINPSPGRGIMTLTAHAPTVRQRMAIPVAILALSGLSPTEKMQASVPVGEMSFEGKSPIIVNASVQTVSIPVAILSLSAPTPVTDTAISVPMASLALTPKTPVSKQNRLHIPVASINMLSGPPGVHGTYSVDVPPAELSLVALSPTHRQKPSVALGALNLIALSPTQRQRLSIPVATLSLSGKDPILPGLSPSRFTSHFFSGSQSMLVYEPVGYDNNADNYRSTWVFIGSGQVGQPTNRNVTVGTGNGVTTVFGGSLTATQPILHTSVALLVNDIQVATGKNGVITGAGITGTYTVTNPGTFSVTFSVPPGNGLSIKFTYTQNVMLKEGYHKVMNAGDEPSNTLVFFVQTTGGWTLTTHWDAAVAYARANFRVDTNRMCLIGHSFGGNIIQLILTSRQIENAGLGQYTFAAFIMIAPDAVSVPGSGSSAYTNSSNKRKLLISGSADTANGIMVSILSNSGTATLVLPIESILHWGLGHSENLWTLECFSRKNRTDSVGAASFDFIDDFFAQASINAEDQATDFVTQAEDLETSESYMVANIQVNNLSAGLVKSALQVRMAALKTLIGTWVIIDLGNTSYQSGAPINNLIAATAGSSLSNLPDDTGFNTGWGFQIVTPTDPTPATAMVADIGSQRLRGQQFGLDRNANRDGMRVGVSVSDVGVMKFTGLNNAHKYSIQIGAATSTGTYTTLPMPNRAELQVVIGGTTKYLYSDLNSREFMQYDTLSPVANEISITASCRQTSDTEKILYIQWIKIRRES